MKPAAIVVAGQRDLGGKRGSLDPWHGIQPPQHVIVKREHGLVLRPARPDERDVGGDDPVRLESGIGREQPIDGAVHQSRARDEQQCNRHLRHHEQLARAKRAAAARLPSLAQDRLQIGARRRPRRHEPERHEREHRDARAHEQHPGIGRRRAEARHQHGRVRRQQLQAPPRQRDAGDRRKRRHHERLGEQLPHEAEAIGPDRRPHRELALAIRRARDEQSRDVRAGDEQQKRDGADEHLQRPPHRARNFVAERADDRCGPLVVGRMLEPQRGLHARELRRGPLDRRARPQPRDGFQVLTRSARRRSAHGVAERRPQLRRRVVVRGDHGLERRGHHARHEVRHAVQRDGRSRDVRARTESAPPQSVRQHHDTQPGGIVLGLREVSPERRPHTEQLEVVPRHTHPLELRSAAFVDDRRLPPANERKLIERWHARPPVERRFESDVANATVVVARPDDDETIGGRIGHGLNQRAIGRGADHGRRADADGEREDRDRGKPRRAPDRAKREVKILPESVHERSPVQQG